MNPLVNEQIPPIINPNDEFDIQDEAIIRNILNVISKAFEESMHLYFDDVDDELENVISEIKKNA